MKTSPHPKPYTAKPMNYKPMKLSTIPTPTSTLSPSTTTRYVSSGYQSSVQSTVAPVNYNGAPNPPASLGSIMTTAATKDIGKFLNYSFQEILYNIWFKLRCSYFDCLECGVPAMFSRPETRIVGGKDASFGRWPWQVMPFEFFTSDIYNSALSSDPFCV